MSGYYRKYEREDRTDINRGIGFLGGLQLLLIGLKLAGIIDWPWTAVLAPTWGPILMVLLFMFLMLCIFAVAILLDNLK